jgi:hypothetical protein
MVFKHLQDIDLQYNIKKYKFYTTEVIYLGLIISHNKIKINFKKVAAIIN